MFFWATLALFVLFMIIGRLLDKYSKKTSNDMICFSSFYL